MKKINIKGWGINQNSSFNFEKVNDSDSGSYYFLSNDRVDTSQFSVLGKNNSVYVGIGNIHSLHVLSKVIESNKIIDIIFIDININQLKYLEKTIKYIISSKSRSDFVEKLFCIKLDSEVKTLLSKLENLYPGVKGEELKKRHIDIERMIWDTSKFNAKSFEDKYNIRVKKFDLGLKTEGKVNFGGIANSTYHLVECSESISGYVPFTLGYGSGFLSSEEVFNDLRKVLSKTRIAFINGDLTHDFASIFPTIKYFTIFLWTSNIFDLYFIQKFPSIKNFKDKLIQLVNQREPIFPEYEIIEMHDERTKTKFPSILRLGRKDLSSHTLAFREVSNLLKGKTAEVVSYKEWIVEDKGISKLYNADYVYIYELTKKIKTFDTIFLHCLLEGELTKYQFIKFVKYLLRLKVRIVILEHNASSKDFYNKIDKFFTLNELIALFGEPNYSKLVSGKNSKDRNILMLYES